MYEEKFVGYIGDYRVHDSRIKRIESYNNTIQVTLISGDNEPIIAKFIETKSVNSNNPEDMILYSISEMKEQTPFRKFVFVNENEDDDSSLEIIAQDCIIQ